MATRRRVMSSSHFAQTDTMEHRSRPSVRVLVVSALTVRLRLLPRLLLRLLQVVGAQQVVEMQLVVEMQRLVVEIGARQVVEMQGLVVEPVKTACTQATRTDVATRCRVMSSSHHAQTNTSRLD